MTWENRTPKDCYAWYCFVGDEAGFSNFFRLVSCDYGKPMWFVEVADLSPLHYSFGNKAVTGGT